MAQHFDVYPQDIATGKPKQPVTLAQHGTVGDTMPFTQFIEHVGTLAQSGGAAGNMFIRIVMLDLPGNPAGGLPPAPTVVLRVNNGTPSPLNDATHPAGQYYPVSDATGDIGDAIIITNTNPYIVGINVHRPGATWNIQIVNNDNVPHAFTWVVADSDDAVDANNNHIGAKQPWLHITPGSLSYTALTNQLISPDLFPTNQPFLTAFNYGTAPLTIQNVSPGSNFSIVAPVPTIAPNDSTKISIQFQSPTVGSFSVPAYQFQSNDTTALADPTTQHNSQVSLNATAGKIEAILLLDASGSMAYTPHGDPTLLNSPTTRWSLLREAAKLFLQLLGHLGSGEGRFGIAMYPDITQPGYPNDIAPAHSSADIKTSADIDDPTQANSQMQDAINRLYTHVPAEGKGATPMGAGIARVIGKSSTDDGYFQSDSNALQLNRRFLLLMSDGANNDDSQYPPDDSSPDPTNFFAAGHPFPAFRDKKVNVMTIGYGDENATQFKPDFVLMGNIANSTSAGSFLAPNASSNGQQILKAFRTAATAGLSLQPISDPEGVLTSDNPEVRSSIVITPYDTKVVFIVSWQSLDSTRIDVSLFSPTCEQITFGQHADPNIFISSSDRYKMIALNHDYLSNANNPASPRYGTWTLAISLFAPVIMERPAVVAAAAVDSEPYSFDVISDSRLKLHMVFDRADYAAGDQIELTAFLTLDGLPVQHAGVSLELTAPGQSSDNILASTSLTADEMQQARDKLKGEPDVNALGIKSLAIALKGSSFDPAFQVGSIPLTFLADQGVYKTTIKNTTVPGTYDFHVIAIGQTKDGVQFRREQRKQLRVVVRPEASFTLFNVAYRQQLVNGTLFSFADILAAPRDRFGNVVLVDPATSRLVALTATGGEFTGGLVGNLDGSYSRTLRYQPESRPILRLTVDDQPVIPRKAIATIARLHYVDKVLAFEKGAEAEPGANQHIDPQAALGDITTKDAGRFVSLGGYGSLSVAIDGQLILGQGNDDITVFVHTDEDLRPYTVEALLPTGHAEQNDWVSLGNSSGVTQPFGLGVSKLSAAKAIRIRDLSGRLRANGASVSHTPGVSITGVGARKIGIHEVERRLATSSGFMVQSTFGIQGDFELVVPAAQEGLSHCVRDNDDSPTLPWNGPTLFAQSLGQVAAASLIQSTFGFPGNLEVVARVGDRLVHFWRDCEENLNWHGPIVEFAHGVSGNPALIQGRTGKQGNFELVVPLAPGGIQYHWRDNDLPNHPWHEGEIFGTELGKIDAVALIQSDFGQPGNLEVVARVKDRLFHFWRESLSPVIWHATSGPNGFFSGATGIPGFIQSQGGGGTHEDFHVVTPISNGGLQHIQRDGNHTDPHTSPWHILESFGSGTFTSASLLQSNFTMAKNGEHPGPGDLEVAARIDNRTAHYWQRDLAPFIWSGPTAYACS